MRRVALPLIVLVSLAAGAQPVAAAGFDSAKFRYQRPLVAKRGGEPVLVEPDRALFERSAAGFADLRVADARGREVPWRHGSSGRGGGAEPVRVINSGRRGRFAVAGAKVSGARERPRLVRRAVRSVSRHEDGTHTIITVDLGFRDVPVDELRVGATTPRYERPVTVLGSNRRGRFVPLTTARVFRFPGSTSSPINVRAHHRYLRVEVENGDDPPLRGIEVSASSRSRALLVEGGRPRPYTVHYENSGAGAPRYDFARLPASAIAVRRAVHGRLGPVRETAALEPPPDTRPFTARNPGLVTAGLVIAALALGAVGMLTLRRRP